MSFDVVLICIRKGEAATFNRTLFEEIFCREAIDPQLPLTSITYHDGGAQIDGAEDGDEIENLVFHHCGGETFYAALHELADRSGSVVLWPAKGRQIAVTRQAIVAHLPPDLADLGPPYIVANGRELAACILGRD